MTPPRIGVGDLSLRFGGDWSPDHACHENGTEVDFRYVRSDDTELGIDLGSADSIYYDLDATVALMNYLFDNSNPIKIIVSPHSRLVFTGIDTAYDTTHNNHFHLRIQDPDGTGN